MSLMTDEEIVRLCGEAMGYVTEVQARKADGFLWARSMGNWSWYWPLRHIDQVMDMILKFDIQIQRDYVAMYYPDYARSDIPNLSSITTHAFKVRSEIPRCVCLCVADMQQAARLISRKKANA